MGYQSHADKVPGLFNAEIRNNFQDLKEVLQMSKTEERDIPRSCKSSPRRADSNSARSPVPLSHSPPRVRIWNIGPIGGDPWMLQGDQRELALALLTRGYGKMIEDGYKTPKFKEMMRREQYHIKDMKVRKANSTPRKKETSLRSEIFKMPPQAPAPLNLTSSFSMPTPKSSAGILFDSQDSGNSSSGELEMSRYFSEELDEMLRHTAIHSLYEALEDLQNANHYILEDDAKTNGHLRFVYEHSKTVQKRNRLIAIHNAIVSISKSLGLPEKKGKSVFFRYIPTDANILNTLPECSNSAWYWAPKVSKRSARDDVSLSPKNRRSRSSHLRRRSSSLTPLDTQKVIGSVGGGKSDTGSPAPASSASSRF